MGFTVQVPSNTTPLELTQEAYCHFTPAHVAAYCEVKTMDKTLVAPADCKTWRYNYGSLDSDRDALERCRTAGLSGCHIEDRQGDMCFTAGMQAWAQEHFRDYCAARTPKNFFMRSDGSRLWWTNESDVSHTQCPGCYLYDHNGGRCPCNNEPGDMRCHLQGCVQYQPYWCWATSVAIVAGYYFPDQHPNTGGDGPNCRGLECEIVGQILYPHDPGMCCRDKDRCWKSHARNGDDIVDALNLYTKIPWSQVYPANNVHESIVRTVLMDGHPILWDVVMPGGDGKGAAGGHTMIIGGTDGKGLFYVHDSMNTHGKGSFQTLTWSQILSYELPWTEGAATLCGVYVPSHYVSR